MNWIKKYVWAALLASMIMACSSISKARTTNTKVITPTVAVKIPQLNTRELQKFNYFFLEAERLKLKGNIDEAYELYKHCLDINPESSEVLAALAQFYFYLKEDSIGMLYMEKTVQNEPDNYWYSQNLAGIYQQQNKIDKAINLLKSMQLRFPDNDEPLVGLLDLYNQKKDYKSTISVLNELESRNGKSEQISQEKLRMYLILGDNKKAYEEVESLSNEYPDDMQYRCLLGDVYLNNGKTKEAYNIYQNILTKDPHDEQALLSIINYYAVTNQKNLYEQNIDTLLMAKDVNVDTKINMMRQFITGNGQGEADSTKIIPLFNKVINVDTTDTQLPMLYSQYLIAKNMNKQVVPVLEKIVKTDPTNIPCRLQLLSYAIKDDDYKRAIQICEPALEATPDIVDFYYYLAISYFQSGNQDKAQEICLKGIAKITSQTDKSMASDFYSIIGDAYHTKGIKEKAYAAYDSSLIYKPENIGTLNNYAYYLSEDNYNLSKAEEMSYKTVKAEPNNDTYLDTYAWILFMEKRYAESKLWIDNCMKNGGEKNHVELEHCGDIYYLNGLKEEAVTYWKKSLDAGNTSETLKKKIEQQKYIAK